MMSSGGVSVWFVGIVTIVLRYCHHTVTGLSSTPTTQGSHLVSLHCHHYTQNLFLATGEQLVPHSILGTVTDTPLSRCQF